MAKKMKNYNAENAKLAFHEYIVSEEANGEFRAYCPVCEDPNESSSPSASFNFEDDVWHCMSECAGNSGAYWKISSLIPQLKDLKGFDYRSKLMKGRNTSMREGEATLLPGAKKTPRGNQCTEENVQKWHQKLFATPIMLTKLMQERGFTEETIRSFQIGFDGQRYSIPVRDEDGNLVNIRLYKMGAAQSKNKMISVSGGVGEARLFNSQIIKDHDVLVFCEGETDCMLLNQHGIPAVTHTGGAATFKRPWAAPFLDKTVYICYDADEVGRTGAKKAAAIIGTAAKNVFRIDLGTEIPDKGADVTDYLHREGYTGDDFKSLMADAKPMNAEKYIMADSVATEGRKVSLEESMSESLQGEILEVVATVAGKQNPPYKVPRRFGVTCGMNKNPSLCEMCPVGQRNGDMVMEISKNDPDLFRFVDINEDKINKGLKEISGAQCTSHSQYRVEDHYYMEQLSVRNSVDDRVAGMDQTPVDRDIFSVSTHATKVNTTSRFVGKNVASPKNQRLSFMAWHNEPVKTSLENFVLDDEIREELYKFQVDTSDPDKDPSALKKCMEIAHDISTNVTRIYGRDILHVAYDLVWHSPLSFDVEGRRLDKGWLEMMVVGDTRTGKSETAMRLADHYQAGIVKSCESMSFAGLVGGNQQMGSGQWFTTWGVVPLNDRRLVVLDEVSGLKEKDVIENMSSIRSSGIAQITKINTQETSARTRLVWITNPSDGVMIDERAGVGIDALKTVVKNQEDIARFDFVMAARASEVDASIINQDPDAAVPHKYTHELCSNLVLWVWSLQPDQIEFTDAAVEEARKIAQEIGEQYVPDPPLLQVENARFKLYRIAAAIAARTFHIRWRGKDDAVLRVNKDHVIAAKEFLDAIYDSRGMEYRSKSRRVIESREKAKKMRAAAKSYILENPDTVWATLKQVQESGKFRPSRDLQEFGGMTRDSAAAAVQILTDKFGMLHRKNEGYAVMDKMLVNILRELEEEGY